MSSEGGTAAGHEEWSLDAAPTGRKLKASGTRAGDEAVAWSLEARFSPGGALDSMELQARPEKRPQEVTTVAVRCYGGRAFGTAIPPGGVPDKFETRFEVGSAIRAFSTALDGLFAVGAPLKVGHARRLLVVALDGASLVPRIGEGMLLARGKERAQTPGGEEWCLSYEFRWADAPGRAETTWLVTRAGVVLRSQRDAARGPCSTKLTALEA